MSDTIYKCHKCNEQYTQSIAVCQAPGCHGAVTLWITLEQLKAMPLRLKFLSHSARDVITRSRMRDDLVLWQQAQLITLCNNYPVDAVLGLLAPSEKAVSKRLERSDMQVAFRNEMFLSQALEWRIREKGMGQDACLETKDTRGHRRSIARHGDVTLTPLATFNLWVVDSKLLAADWTVRLKTLADLLNRVSTPTLEGILGECNYPRMSAVIADLEAFFGSIKDSADALENAPAIKIDTPTKVDPEMVRKFQEQIKAFDDMEKAERGEG